MSDNKELLALMHDTNNCLARLTGFTFLMENFVKRHHRNLPHLATEEPTFIVSSLKDNLKEMQLILDNYYINQNKKDE